MNTKLATALIIATSFGISACSMTKKAPMADPAPTVVETPAPAAPAADSAEALCASGGAAVVTWTDEEGNPIEACRREDGVEYALKDAQYFVE